jgi:hypothetical protein
LRSNYKNYKDEADKGILHNGEEHGKKKCCKPSRPKYLNGLEYRGDIPIERVAYSNQQCFLCHRSREDWGNDLKLEKVHNVLSQWVPSTVRIFVDRRGNLVFGARSVADRNPITKCIEIDILLCPICATLFDNASRDVDMTEPLSYGNMRRNG